MATRAKPSPVVLSGPPGAVRGVVTLANTGDARLVIRGAVIHLPKRPPITVALTALVDPGVTAQAAVSADLGDGWPAGSVHGELEVNGQRRELELRVAARVGLSVSPTEVLVTSGTNEIDLLVTNTGNVPLPLARLTRGRLRAHDEDEPAEDAPSATLTLKRSTLVEPGEQASLSAAVEVPDGLDRARRHHARLPIGPADLAIIVLPLDPPPRKARTSASRPKES